MIQMPTKLHLPLFPVLAPRTQEQGKPLEKRLRWQFLHGDKEPLAAALARRLVPGGFGPKLDHPLLIAPLYMPPMNTMYNEILHRKQELVSKAMRSKEWGVVIALHEGPHRVEAFVKLAPKLGDREYWSILGWLWIQGENGHRRILKRLLMSARPSREFLMDDTDREALAHLPTRLVCHRGQPRRSPPGWSWTLDRAQAVWCASWWAKEGRDAVVLTGEVSKSELIALFSIRGESEVVVEPKHVQVTRIERVRR